jgi:hypothetical protein
MFSTSGDVNLVESLMKENNLVIEKKLIKVQD